VPRCLCHAVVIDLVVMLLLLYYAVFEHSGLCDDVRTCVHNTWRNTTVQVVLYRYLCYLPQLDIGTGYLGTL
jgi:hypothetical protein